MIYSYILAHRIRKSEILPWDKISFLAHLGLHYNQYVILSVRPFVCYQLVKMLINLEVHGLFYHISHTYACQYSLTTDRFWIAVQLSGLLRSVEKTLVTLEFHGIFESNFA